MSPDVGEHTLADGLAAGAVAALLSGAPSTLHSLVTRRPVLEPTLAAGTLLLPRGRRTLPLLAAALPVHVALSLGWGVAIAALAPRGAELRTGVAAGLAIAAFDLGVVGRRYPRIRALPPAPQVADHVAYGAVVGAVLRARRLGRSSR